LVDLREIKIYVLKQRGTPGEFGAWLQATKPENRFAVESAPPLGRQVKIVVLAV
jgi:hypothetical protein